MKLCRVLPLLATLLLASCKPGTVVTDQPVIDAENAVRVPGIVGIYSPAEGLFQSEEVRVELAAEEPPQYRVRGRILGRVRSVEEEDDSFTFLVTPLRDDTYLLQFDSDLKSAEDFRSELPADQAAERYYSYRIVRVIGERSVGMMALHAAGQAILGVMIASDLDRVIASWGRSGLASYVFFRGDRESALAMFLELSRLEIRINALDKLSGGPLSRSPE